MLKNIGLTSLTSLVIFVSALSFSALAQNTKSEPTVLKLGKRKVVVPAPNGLVEGAARFDHLKSRFVATESADNDMLAVFVPESIVPALKKGEIPPYDQWAKISILKEYNTTDVNAASFMSFANEFEKMSPQLIDEKSPVFKRAVLNSRKGLAVQLGEKVEIDISQPKSLGVFDRKTNTHSTLIVLTLNDALGARLILGTLTLLRVNQRLLFVYTYHNFTQESDVERVRLFTKQWTSEILAANQ